MEGRSSAMEGREAEKQRRKVLGFDFDGKQPKVNVKSEMLSGTNVMW
jgi:hypothetical protein